ncbi:MAG: hypothetical protein FWD74_12475, partial [Actinomycetia bacterium]|nr:hypothetical protein [Actinomycetes bacterium]
MTRGFQPVDADRVPDLLAATLAGRGTGTGPRASLPSVGGEPLAADGRPSRTLRVAVDGPPCADPAGFAHALVAPLRLRARPAVVIATETFWRDAALRLEHGRTDALSYRHDWLDADALRREVLDPLGPGGSGRYLPSLRDPATNRATRAGRVAAEPGAVLLVAGPLLFGRGLPFDWTIHLDLNAAARARHTPTADAWTLPAFDDYDTTVD